MNVASTTTTHQLPNPFEAIKANQLTEREVRDFWAEPPGGWRAGIDPSASLARFILGGKGCGRTHLMRFVERQSRPHQSAAGLTKPGDYVGVWMLCSGLNAQRFRNKGQSTEYWQTVFAYEMDLFMAQLTLKAWAESFPRSPLFRKQRRLCNLAWDLWNVPPRGTRPLTLDSLIARLRSEQKRVDYQVDNTRKDHLVAVSVRATGGAFALGLPAIMQDLDPVFRHVRTLYLIDEMENLPEPHQQAFVQTLVRERTSAVGFVLGAKKSGIHTYHTLSGELNRQGHEYSVHLPDQVNRQSKREYRSFCLEMVRLRLQEARNEAEIVERTNLHPNAWLETVRRILPRSSESLAQLVPLAKRDRPARERPYWNKFLQRIRERSDFRVGDGERAVELLQHPELPLVEKASLLLLYRRLGQRPKVKLLAAAEEIAHDASIYVRSGNPKTEHFKLLDKLKDDFVAQVFREYGGRPPYAGLDTFLIMSQGLPRLLLVLLRDCYDSALFNGERPLVGAPISVEAQQQGIRKAVSWFWDTSIVGEGEFARVAQAGVGWLAELFRAMRYSDMLYESSCATFSVDSKSLMPITNNLLDVAVQCSLLIKDGDRIDRSTHQVLSRYQLSPMLGPRWDLPVVRRGVVPFQPEQVDTIFGGNRSAVQELVRRFTRNPPAVADRADAYLQMEFD